MFRRACGHPLPQSGTAGIEEYQGTGCSVRPSERYNVEISKMKPNSQQPMGGERATGSDVHQILGAVDDSMALAILALHPTVTQLEEARVWLAGEGDVLGKEHR